MNTSIPRSVRPVLVLLAALAVSAPTAFAQPPDSTGSGVFEVVGVARPSPAPLGHEVAFFVTVTNVTADVQAFVVNGCPVRYEIDGAYFPRWDCAEFARRIEIKPGGSVTFGPEDDPRLIHEPHVYPLAPGHHQATLEVSGAGRAVAHFTVQDPPVNLAFLAGRLVFENGEPVREGTVYLTTHPEDIAAGPPPPGETHAAWVGPEGWFLFAGIPPQTYHLRAEALGAVVRYPGDDPDPAGAGTITLGGGSYRDDIRFIFGAGPPPPPPLYPITGTVFARNSTDGGFPLAGAVVMAIPDRVAVRDSVPATRFDVNGDVGPDGGIPRFLAYTGRDGRFELGLPDGRYRLLAGNLVAHRYQYLDHAERFGEAEVLWVPDPRMAPILEPRFHLATLEGAPLARIEGLVLSSDPQLDRPAEPLEGAVVTAYPVLPSMLADPAPHRAETGPDGRYVLEVPADTPYVVGVEARGHERRFYPQATHPLEADLVDVAPGRTTRGIHFTLAPRQPGDLVGAIEGAVFRSDPLVDCGQGTDCYLPAAGALVRIAAAYPTFAPYEIRTRTDRDGRFRVEGIPAQPDGSLAYYVSAELAGYEPAFHPGGVPFDRAEPLAVYPGRAASAGRIILSEPGLPGDRGFLAGILTDPDGGPVAQARVRLFLDPEDPRGRVVSGHTGPDGRFHLTGMPELVPVLLAAEAEGYLPAYYPNAHRWTWSQPVTTGGPTSFQAPVEMTLYPAPAGGPYIQAGRVRVAEEEGGGGVPGEDGSLTGGAWPSETASTGLDERRLALLEWHRSNLPGAFLYLVDALSAAPTPPIRAGGSTGDNGTVVLTDLMEGVYQAYADRPGYETAWFANAGDAVATLVLNESTPAVLADIRLAPRGIAPGEDEEREAVGMVKNLTNAPNPFRPRTSISFELEEPAAVSLQVFDYRGRLVKTLLVESELGEGYREIPWDGTDEDGRRVSSGVYFYRLTAAQAVWSRKMVVLP